MRTGSSKREKQHAHDFLVGDGPGFGIGPNDGAFFLGSEDARGVPSGVTTLEETKGGACLLSCLWCVFVSSKSFFLKVPPFAVDLAVEFVNLLAAFDHELVRVWARERRGGQAAATTEERK